MFESLLFFIEGIIISIFDTRYTKKKIKIIYVILFAAVFSCILSRTEQFHMGIYYSTLIIAFILFLFNCFYKYQNIVMNLFISCFIALSFTISSSVRFVHMTTHIQRNVIESEYEKFLIQIISICLLTVILWHFDRKQIFKEFKCDMKYVKQLVLFGIGIFLIAGITTHAIYMTGKAYNYVYIIVIMFILLIIALYSVILSLSEDSIRLQEQNKQILALKEIEKKYIASKVLNERNEEIKHDLEYFKKLIDQKAESKKLTEALDKTISKINDKEIKIYASDNVLNEIIKEISKISKKYHQDAMFTVNTGTAGFPIESYSQVIELTEKICQNNDSDRILVNVRKNNQYIIIEYMIKPIEDISYENEGHVFQTNTEDREIIRFIVEGKEN